MVQICIIPVALAVKFILFPVIKREGYILCSYWLAIAPCGILDQAEFYRLSVWGNFPAAGKARRYIEIWPVNDQWYICEAEEVRAIIPGANQRIHQLELVYLYPQRQDVLVVCCANGHNFRSSFLIINVWPVQATRSIGRPDACAIS